MKDIVVIGAAGGYGALNQACQDAPEMLRTFDFLDQLKQSGITYSWGGIVHLQENHADPLLSVAEMCTLLAEKIRETLSVGNFPIVVGGDHSCAMGTWSGAKSAIDGRLGLIWIDAHMDSHTFQTSKSRAIHGMPLAALLGYGDQRLTHIASPFPKLQPEDVCLIGVRSFEEDEAKLLKRLGVRVFFMEEIRRRSIDAVLEEALSIVGRETAGFGVSIDLDALDPEEEPGVGSPVPGGLLKDELSAALKRLRGDKHLLAIEVVEYNPYLDRKFATARAISDLLAAMTPSQSTPACRSFSTRMSMSRSTPPSPISKAKLVR